MGADHLDTQMERHYGECFSFWFNRVPMKATEITRLMNGHPTFLYRVKSQKHYNTKTIAAFCDAVGISMSQFFGSTEKVNPYEVLEVQEGELERLKGIIEDLKDEMQELKDRLGD